ncbi:hypothetical protein Tco_0416339, partial [Tanacetum coccineum]
WVTPLIAKVLEYTIGSPEKYKIVFMWIFDLDILPPSMNYIPVRKENQVDTAVKQSNSVDFEDVDDQQFIVHGSSSIGNKAVSEAITYDA